MAFNRHQNNFSNNKQSQEERKKMEQLMQKYIRNKKYSKNVRKIYGDDWVQPQCINIELCYEDEFGEQEKKMGLKQNEKFGTVVIDTKYQDDLERVVFRHYTKTKFKDPKQSAMAVKKLFKETLSREKPSPDKDASLSLKLRQSISLKKSIKNRNLSINPGANPLLLEGQKSMSIGGRSPGNRTHSNTPNNMTTDRIINNYSSIRNNGGKIDNNPRMNMTPQA